MESKSYFISDYVRRMKRSDMAMAICVRVCILTCWLVCLLKSVHIEMVVFVVVVFLYFMSLTLVKTCLTQRVTM